MSIEEQIYRRFHKEVLTPLIGAVATKQARTQDVRATIDRIMSVTADFAASLEDEPNDLNKPSTEYRPRSASNPVNGTAPTPLDEWLAAVKQFPPRNRSIARKIEILSLLAEKNGAVSLAELHNHLIACGLSEKGGQAAVVTQLSRLRKDELVNPGGHGFYSRTVGVANALQTHRRTYPSLCLPDAVRDLMGVR